MVQPETPETGCWSYPGVPLQNWCCYFRSVCVRNHPDYEPRYPGMQHLRTPKWLCWLMTLDDATINWLPSDQFRWLIVSTRTNKRMNEQDYIVQYMIFGCKKNQHTLVWITSYCDSTEIVFINTYMCTETELDWKKLVHKHFHYINRPANIWILELGGPGGRSRFLSLTALLAYESVNCSN